ncbi:MAG: hypothetical protein ACR2LJ_10220 [Acidimicrobiales bacterium]
MTEVSGTPGWWQATETEQLGSAVGTQTLPRPGPRHVRREMPRWLPQVAGAVLVCWPVTFVLGLLGSGIWLLVVSIMLALLAIPALIVLMVHADLQGRRSPATPVSRDAPWTQEKQYESDEASPPWSRT